MNRTLARELAFKLVFIRCTSGIVEDEAYLSVTTPAKKLNDHLTTNEFLGQLAQQDLNYIKSVTQKTDEKFDFVKKVISDYSNEFAYERIFKADLAILHLIITEILYFDLPIPVAANEAVELAKAYSSDKSASFINGIIATVGKVREQILNGENN